MVVATALLLLLYIVGFVLGGELGSFMGASLETVPFAALAVFAYLGATRSGGKIAAIVWLLGVVAAIAVLSLLNSFLAVLVDPILRPGVTPEFIEGGPIRLLLVFLGIGLSILIGLLGFIPAARRWLSRLLPLNPDDFVHTIALVAVATLTLMAFVPLVFLAEPPLLTLVTGLVAEGADLMGRDDAGLLRDEIYGLMWLIPAVIFAVGYGIRRNLVEALQRLGLVKPTLKQIFLGGGLAMVLVFGVVALDWGIGWLWGQVGWSRTDGEAFGLRVHYLRETELSGTAGPLRKLAQELAGERFLVIYADNLTDLDLTELLSFHDRTGAELTVALHREDQADLPSKSVADTADDGRLLRFVEKPAPADLFSTWASAGIYVIDPSVIDIIPVGVQYDIGRGLIPALLRDGRSVFGFKVDFYLMDIGTPDGYARAQADLSARKIS